MKITLVIWILIIFFGGAGWVQNLIKLTNADFETPYKTEIIRSIGVIPIVGAVTGWMDIGEETTQ